MSLSRYFVKLEISTMIIFLTILLHIRVLAQHARTDDLSTGGFGPAHHETLQQMCPLHNVCSQKNDTTILQGYSTCCASCSCNEDCRVEGKCCWGQKAIYSFLQRRLYQCLIPITKSRMTLHEKSMYAAYFMVEECPTEHVASQKCGDRRVADWGSLQPVYSPSKKRTYKNKLCAQCHSVNDTVPWKMQTTCDTDAGTIPFAEIFETFSRDKDWPNYCYVFFFHPIKEEDTGDERCFVDPVSDCTEHIDTNSYTDANISAAEVKEACLSDFIAPVIITGMVYKNSFCARCHGVKRIIKYCPVIFGDGLRQVGKHELTLLLNKASYTVDESKIAKGIQEACYDDNGTLIPETCRPVLCPSGQRLTPTGTCKHISTRWGGYILLNVKLPTPTLSWSNLPLTKRNLLSNINIILPSGGKWQVIRMFAAHFDDPPDSLSYLLCSVIYIGKSSEPETIISEVRDLLEHPWTILLSADRSISVAPKWLEYFFDHFRRNNVGPLVHRHFNESLRIVPLLTLIYLDPLSYDKRGGRLNKLMICNQVILSENETTLDGPMLYIKRDRKYLLDDLYVVSSSESGSTIRVCLDDTDMRIRTFNIAGTSRYCVSVIVQTVALFFVSVVPIM